MTTTKHYPYVLSCDWFAFSCLSTWAEAQGYYPSHTEKPSQTREGLPVLSGSYYDYLFRPVLREGKNAFIERKVGDVITYKHYEFRICESLERHSCFACAVRVCYNGLDICHLFYGDKRERFSHKCLAKVANSLLYTSNWATIFTDCLRALGWRWVGVNRLDLCCDFNYFANGRLPALFVADYLHKPTKNRPSFLRRGSNKWRAVGERTISANMIDTLSWGKRDSPVQVNLYNKTKELLEVHSKPWIVAKWNENGLLHGKDDSDTMHYVWRVEFSINPTALAFRAKDKSQVFDVSLDSVSTQSHLQELFETLLPRYFQFYYLPAQNCPSRVRDLTPVVLFDNISASSKVPMTLNRSINSGRTERLLAKRLRLLMEGQQLTQEEFEHVQATWDVFTKIAADKERADYAPLEDVLSYMLLGIRTWNLKEKPYKLTAEGVQRQASRLARLIVRGDSSDIEKFDELNIALQDVLEAMRQGFTAIYDTLPDEYYNENLESFLSAYDMHVS